MSKYPEQSGNYYALFQPSAYSTGIQPYKPLIRTRMGRPAHQSDYGFFPAIMAAVGITSGGVVAQQQAAESSVDDAILRTADQAQAAFRSGTVMSSVNAAIAAPSSWGGQSISTTPISVEKAQLKGSSLLYLMAMLPGINSEGRKVIGGLAEEMYDDATSIFSIDSADPQNITDTYAEIGAVVTGAASVASSNGANPSDVKALVSYAQFLSSYANISNIERRQTLEQDKFLSTQAGEAAGDLADQAGKLSCQAQRLVFGPDGTSGCPDETGPEKFGRFAMYAVGGLVGVGALLYLGRPYLEAAMGFVKDSK